MIGLNIYSVLKKMTEWSKRIKFCAVCGRSIHNSKYKKSIYHCTMTNSFGQMSFRYSCNKCGRKYLKDELKRIQVLLEDIPDYRKRLKIDIKEINGMLK